jgi:hypothetical protein
MIRRVFGIVLMLVGIWALPAAAAQRIELMDGTVLQGEILSFDGKTYTIRGDSIGTVKVEGTKVRSIQKDSGASPGKSGDLQDLRSRIMTNPQTMGMVMGLQDEPEVKEVLQDEEILKAMEKGDIEWLMSNPKIQRLLQNPKVQEVGKSVQK